MEEFDETKIISKYTYNFILENHKNKSLKNIELILENYSNEKIILTLYQFSDESISIYSNIFSVDYFMNQSSIIKCILLMSKNNHIKKIIDIIISRLNYDKNNNSNNLTYNEKKMSFRIKKYNTEDINLIIYITLINLQKEKISIHLKQKKYIIFQIIIYLI